MKEVIFIKVIFASSGILTSYRNEQGEASATTTGISHLLSQGIFSIPCSYRLVTSHSEKSLQVCARGSKSLRGVWEFGEREVQSKNVCKVCGGREIVFTRT